MFFLDEVKQHNDVAHDHADQAGNTEKCHEAERGTHDPQSSYCTHDSVGRRGKHQKWFDCAVELDMNTNLFTMLPFGTS